jgi:hypothetical protein
MPKADKNPVLNGQRDQKGRFVGGHVKLGGRRPAREKALTLIPGSQAPAGARRCGSA